MLEWLLKTLGISQSLTGRLDEVQLMWARPTVLLVGLILLLPIAFFIVVRHRNSLPHVSRSVRGVLSAGSYLIAIEPYGIIDDVKLCIAAGGSFGKANLNYGET